MMLSQATEARRENFAKVREYLVRLQERRADLSEREQTLVTDVTAARGRLSLQPQIETFLDGLQADANARTVGAYSRLLTAITQDILGRPDVGVALDLYTERGLPALDINAIQDGNVVDVFDGTGGSFTNVVCLGLRAIATAKAKLRPFLLLDEPDCWMEEANIEPYFRVLKQMADRMGFQVLVITHHDVNRFDFAFNYIRLKGTPESGLTAETRGGTPHWEDDSIPGLRGISLKNYASFADGYIPLGPGLNMASGANHIGKSRVTRAFRSVFYGGQSESNDGDIRHGQMRADIEVRAENGRTLYWSREIKRNPVTTWRLIEADGSVASVESMHCDSGKLEKGSTVPKWLLPALGIGLVDGLDLQITHQKRPIFLLNEPPSRRASVLSIGRESSWIKRMIQQHRDDVTRDNGTVKRGEVEVGQIRPRLKALDDLDAIEADMVQASVTADAAVEAECAALAAASASAALLARRQRVEALEAQMAVLAEVIEPPPIENERMAVTAMIKAATRISGARRKVLHLHDQQAILADLPQSEPSIRPCSPVIEARERMLGAASAVAALEDALGVLTDLPAREPGLPHDTRTIVASAARIGSARTLREQIELDRNSVDRQITDKACDIANTLLEAGNLCPICGTETSAEHLLRHSGGRDEAA